MQRHLNKLENLRLLLHRPVVPYRCLQLHFNVDRNDHQQNRWWAGLNLTWHPALAAQKPAFGLSIAHNTTAFGLGPFTRGLGPDLARKGTARKRRDLLAAAILLRSERRASTFTGCAAANSAVVTRPRTPRAPWL
jgi:hypothetical protein